MNKKKAFSITAGTILSIVGFYLAFRNVKFSELSDYMTSVDYFWLVPTVALVLLSFAVRSYRWKIILGTDTGIPFRSAYHPLMIGFMINCVLPGRVGELARPAILQQRNAVPFSTGLATVAAERLFDLVMLLGLFVIAFATIDIDPELDIPFGSYNLNKETLTAIGKRMVQLTLILTAGMAFMTYEKSRRLVFRAIMGIPNLLFFAGESLKTRVRDKYAVRVVRAAENFASGFTILRLPLRLAACFGLSVIVWGLIALSFHTMTLGCPGITLSLGQVTAYLAIVSVFIALPSAPGFWGIWEAGGFFALSLFGIPENDAVGFTLVNHVSQVFPIIIAGFVSAFVTGVNILRVSSERNEKEQDQEQD